VEKFDAKCLSSYPSCVKVLMAGGVPKSKTSEDPASVKKKAEFYSRTGSLFGCVSLPGDRINGADWNRDGLWFVSA